MDLLHCNHQWCHYKILSLLSIAKRGLSHLCVKFQGSPNTGLSIIQVPPPALDRPSDDELFVLDGSQRRVDHDYLKNHFIREGRLKEQHALYIIEQATNVLSRERNLVNITSPVTSECPVHFRL